MLPGMSDSNDYLAIVESATLDTYTPRPGWVLVEREDLDAADQLIVIPRKGDDERRHVSHGVVVKIGGEYRHDKTGALVQMEVAVGDRVTLRKYPGHDIRLGDRDFVQVDENDILCILESA